MANHAGSFQNNRLLHVMLNAKAFDSLSREQTKAVLRGLADVEDGSLSDIFEYLPASLGYCVFCNDLRDEVKHSYHYNFSLCKDCCIKKGFDWDNPEEMK